MCISLYGTGGPASVLLRPGSHIVNQSGGRSQSQLRQCSVIKLVWAMWKRHRALNALTGDNMSATQIDHMGALPFTGDASCTETLRRALSPCKRKGRHREVWGSQRVVLQFVFLLHTRGIGSREGSIGSEIARRLIKTRRRLV